MNNAPYWFGITFALIGTVLAVTVLDSPEVLGTSGALLAVSAYCYFKSNPGPDRARR